MSLNTEGLFWARCAVLLVNQLAVSFPLGREFGACLMGWS